MPPEESKPAAPPKHPPAPPEEAPVESALLFAGRSVLAIRHNGKVYRLRRTRLGKLILTA